MMLDCGSMTSWMAIFVLREEGEVSWLQLGGRLRLEGCWLWGDAFCTMRKSLPFE